MSGSAELASLLAEPPAAVAPRLLGAVLRVGEVSLRLTEVEAYAGADDPGSHAFRGPTSRNEVMFGPSGRLYVYLIYGMHHCVNVVCGPEGEPGAVLLRAGEVLAGLAVARERRPGAADRDLARGPARLCRALGIGPGHNGTCLDHDGTGLGHHGTGLGHHGTGLADGSGHAEGFVGLTLAGEPVAPDRVASGPRVGLRRASQRPWRFWIEGEATVSAYRPARPARGSSRTDRGRDATHTVSS
jgi:DNA-3-methyladenine glycosylase